MQPLALDQGPSDPPSSVPPPLAHRSLCTVSLHWPSLMLTPCLTTLGRVPRNPPAS